MSRIKVKIGFPGPNFAEQWAGLAERAYANVFMHPAALNAVHATMFATIHVLLAWDTGVDPEQLVGVWALRESKLMPLWPALLAAPPYKYAFVSDPVIDPALVDDVAAAFFDAIAKDPAMPNVIRLKHLDSESPRYAAMVKALTVRGGQRLVLSEHSRPFASRESGVKNSGSTRKKLRQDWNRLSALGAADIVNDRAPKAVADAFEAFLALEASSWKGGRGTALLSNKGDAAFTRAWLANLAAQGNASVALLRIDGKPIAAQVLLYSGRTAYTWKTAFDGAFAKYSPGALLVDKVTEQLFASGIEAIESCSPKGSFMGQLWTGRRKTVDLLIDVGTRKSVCFALAALGEHGYQALRRQRDRLRALSPFGLSRKRPLAAAR
jgi:CelD/BcsL family acetyltransferase involved in cellulose biosynthesis